MKKTFLAAAVALGALAFAVPANADPRRADHSYNQRSDYRAPAPAAYRHTFSQNDFARLEARIDRGFRTGQLTRPEARRLTIQLNDLKQRARYYWRTDGRMTRRERRDIEVRYDRLAYAVHAQIRDDDRRYSDNRGPRRY
jgi:hypothetical protein